MRTPVSLSQIWFLAFCALFSGPVQAAEGDLRSAHDFSFTAIEGDTLPLAQFAGKAVLVVNSASQCGFTSQYSALADLWARYRDKGLVILAVPSNDFGGQEPGTESDIKQFCDVNYGIDFPMTEKVHVRGEEAHPFYQWAATHFSPLSKPRWNFHKYLIAPDGKLVGWFSSATSPTSEKVMSAIEEQLARATALP
ncbi:MAG: glutathione peroxidase [Alphaproteobacteria bacterium]